ncbi:MAG: DsbA family protein, partial [Bdellovibrionales bacterium]|nr:DsbA family protein [Bdellovibrionales bacterium]
GYLTLHYYPLHLGFSDGEALCTINSQFNCDAVSASRFSAFLGIPMAVWGFATNFILLVMLLVYGLNLTEQRARCLRMMVLISGFTALMSIIMGLISLFYLNTYCLFCILAYISSFFAFEALRREQEEAFFTHIKQDIFGLFTSSRIYLLYFLFIPACALFTHKFFLQQYGADNLEDIVRTSLLEWQAENKFDFSLSPLVQKGAPENQAAMTIVEFADFRCGHCKMASAPLGAFVNSQPDVTLKFYAFPLDSSCNSAIQRGDGLSCRLAKSVYCANQKEKGWDFHKLIFANQEKISRKQTSEEVDWELKNFCEETGIDFNELKTCMDAAETHEAIRKQSELGVSARVEGTPTIYVNGKKLPRGQIINVLSSAYKQIKSQNPK